MNIYLKQVQGIKDNKFYFSDGYNAVTVDYTPKQTALILKNYQTLGINVINNTNFTTELILAANKK